VWHFCEDITPVERGQGLFLQPSIFSGRIPAYTPTRSSKVLLPVHWIFLCGPVNKPDPKDPKTMITKSALNNMHQAAEAFREAIAADAKDIPIKLLFQTTEALSSTEKQLLGAICLRALEVAKPKLKGRLKVVMDKVTQCATTQGDLVEFETPSSNEM
jgi:hypothetical protein